MSFLKAAFPLIAGSAMVILFSCGDHKTETEAPKQETKSPETPDDLKALNEKIVSDPNNAQLYYQRAKIYIQQKDFEAALSDMNRVLQTDTTRAEYYLTIADIHFFTNKTSYTKIYLEKAVELEPTNANAILKLAQLYLYVNKHQESIDQINKVLKQDVHNATAYFMKGMNYKSMGDTAKAISSMQTAVEQNNDYYDAHMQLGLLFAAKGDPLCIEYYNNALKVNPQSKETLYAKAKFMQDSKNTKRAIEVYNMLLTLEPANKAAMFNLGVIFLEDEKEFSSALKYFGDAIAADPQYGEAYCGRGRTYQLMGQNDKAKQDYKRSLELKPNYKRALNYLGTVKG